MKRKMIAGMATAIILGLTAPGALAENSAVYAQETAQGIWEVYCYVNDSGQDTGNRYISNNYWIEGFASLYTGESVPIYLAVGFDENGAFFCISENQSDYVFWSGSTDQLSLSVYLQTSGGESEYVDAAVANGDIYCYLDAAASAFILEDMLQEDGKTVLEVQKPSSLISAYTFLLPHDDSFTACYNTVKNLWLQNQSENTESSDSEGGAALSEQWDWSKGYFTSTGTMYIYTNTYIAGTVKDSNGQTSDAYMTLYQDKDSFFVLLYDSDLNYFSNLTAEDMTLQAQLLWREGEENEFQQDFTATLSANADIVRFSSTANGYMQNSLENAPAPVLLLISPDGQNFRFQIPENSDYYNIWCAVCDYWYIPTFNTDIYTGDDVNPDLVTFLDKFKTAFYEEIQMRQEAGAEIIVMNDILAGDNFNDELTALENQYLELGTGLSRSVDYEYYAACKAQIDQALANYTLNTASDLYGDGADIARALGKDEWADWLEIGEGLLNILAGQ